MSAFSEYTKSPQMHRWSNGVEEILKIVDCPKSSLQGREYHVRLKMYYDDVRKI
jgi:hypothetical protein